MDQERYDWSVAVFGMNEARTIGRCLASVERNAEGRRVHVSVMLNGSTDGSAELLRRHAPRNVTLAVFNIASADKANAINQYIHDVRPEARQHFLMDAYVELRPGALAALSEALEARPEVLAASGVPVNGRSAGWFRDKLLAGGALNGNLSAMRGELLDRFKALGLRLPVHLYRTDGLLGSFVAHDGDALGNPWTSERLIGVAAARYAITPLSIFRPADIRRQYRREINQARGVIESAAIKSVIYAGNYQALPADADDMLRDWLRDNQPRPEGLWSRYFLSLALRALGRPRPRNSAADLVPSPIPGLAASTLPFADDNRADRGCTL